MRHFIVPCAFWAAATAANYIFFAQVNVCDTYCDRLKRTLDAQKRRKKEHIILFTNNDRLPVHGHTLKMHSELFLFHFNIFSFVRSSSLPSSVVVYSLLYLLTLAHTAIVLTENAGDDFFFHCDGDDSENSKFSALIRLSFSSFSFPLCFCIFGLLVLGSKLIPMYIIVSVRDKPSEKKKKKKSFALLIHAFLLSLNRKNHKYFSEAKYSGWLSACNVYIDISRYEKVSNSFLLRVLSACVCAVCHVAASVCHCISISSFSNFRFRSTLDNFF